MEDLLKGGEINMNYKIEQEGYEYRGYKLGQMTNRGMIIGFDTRCDDNYSFIAVESDKSIFNIEDFGYASVILERYKYSMHQWWCANEIEVSEELQNKPNPLQLIRKVIDGHPVKLELFAEEFCISLYDSEIPICWNKDDGVHILTKVINSNINSDMISEIAEVVKIIDENLEWFKRCLNGQTNSAY